MEEERGAVDVREAALGGEQLPGAVDLSAGGRGEGAERAGELVRVAGGAAVEVD